MILSLLGCVGFGLPGLVDDAPPARVAPVDPPAVPPVAAPAASPVSASSLPPFAECASLAAPPPADGCATATLACGQTLEGTTAGGVSAFGDRFYAYAFCFPEGGRHEGPERVYRLAVPEHTDVVVSLASPCADLDLAVMAWSGEVACPTADSPLSECEGGVARGDDRAHLQVFNARDYLVAVDGKRGVTAPFRLAVTCAPLRKVDASKRP